MTLHQHLTDASHTSEVSINLEWRMGIEEVRIGAAPTPVVGSAGYILQQFAIDMIGLVAFMQTSPQVDAPACAPACGLLTLLDECLLSSAIERLWQVITRIETNEVTLMTMSGVVVTPVVVPLVQVAVFSHGIGMQAR